MCGSFPTECQACQSIPAKDRPGLCKAGRLFKYTVVAGQISSRAMKAAETRVNNRKDASIVKPNFSRGKKKKKAPNVEPAQPSKQNARADVRLTPAPTSRFAFNAPKHATQYTLRKKKKKLRMRELRTEKNWTFTVKEGDYA